MLTLKLAWRNLFRNTRRTVLTILLIGFSLTALILADSIIRGTTKAMVESVTGTLAGDVQIHKAGFLETRSVDSYLPNSTELEGILAGSPYVRSYAPRTITGGMISSPYNVSSGLIYGVDPHKEISVSRIRDAIVDGDYLQGNPGEILLGVGMADLLEVGLGDRIVITLAEVDSGTLSQALFRVSGIFEFGVREFDDELVFINLPAARKVLAMGNASHEIAVRLVNPDDALNAELPLFNRLDQDDIVTMGWRDFNPQIGSMIEMTEYSSSIVGLILVLLASLGVINSMFMSIYERVFEFGVIRAMGTTPAAILRLILCEALLIAAISAAFGISLGGSLGLHFAAHGVPLGEFEVSGIVIDDTLPAVLTIDQFVDFPIYMVVLALAAALYPAIYAASIQPASALHKTL